MPVINPEQYFDSAQFLKAEDFKKGETVLVIEGFEEIKTRLSKNQEHGRPCLRFKGHEKPLGLNSTNLRAMIEKHGDDTDKWAGKKVTIYKVKTTNPQDGKEVDGLRLK